MAGFPWRPTPWFRHHHFHHQKPVVAWPSAEMWIPTMASEAKSSSGDRSGMVRYPCGHLWTALNDHKIKLIYIYHYIYIYHIYSYVLRHSPKMIKCLLCTACMTVYVYITMYPTISHICSLNHQIISMLYCAYVQNIYIYIYVYLFFPS